MEKHIPIRTCIGCGKKDDKSNLYKIVKTKDNQIFLDSTQKSDGRGAYICKNISCFEKMTKKHKLDKHYRTHIKEEIYNEIFEEFNRLEK